MTIFWSDLTLIVLDRYVVLEFDKNEVLIDALGGELDSPVWMFRAHLYVEHLKSVPQATSARKR